MKKVLIVDDSAVARRIAKRCLAALGLGEKIVEATNGEEGLKLVKSDPPDLIIADLNMPVMDGVSMLRRIKANPRLAAIPVIVVSSILDDERRTELSGRGVEHLLEKPISPPLLAGAIEALREQQEDLG